MPKEITSLRQFFELTKMKGAKYITVHKDNCKVKERQITKFKLRRPDYLYTIKIQGKEKADKLISSFPQGLIRKVGSKKQK